jgi:solute carrier family 13 (sodium-dependent dicarboxylate transporter), member 2/3/5
MSHAASAAKPGSPGLSGIDLWRQRTGLPLAIFVTLVIWFLPVPSGLTEVGLKCLALFGGIFMLYLTEAVPLPISSLAVVPLAVLMGIATPKDALDGFGSTSVYLLVSAFILATAMVKSRLAERLTYYILKGVGSSTLGVTIGITLANVVLAFLVPSSTARTAILLPVCLGLIATFNVGARSRLAKGLLLTLTFTNATMGAGILTATLPNPITVEFIVKAGGPQVSYMQWLQMGFPPAVVMTIITWWLCRVMFKPEVAHIPGGRAHVSESLAKLGHLSGNEVRALIVFLLVIALWLTGDWTKIDVTVAALAASCLLFVPKLGFMTWDDANKGVSWQVVFVAGGGISLGALMMKTGAAKWLAISILDATGVAGMTTLVVLIVIMLIIQYLHLVFVGTTAMATALLPVVIGMAEHLHVNPLIFALPAGMIIGGYPMLMFYNTLPNILVYGTGELTVGDFPKVGVILCTIAVVLYALCAATYWRWLGFV